MTYQSPINRNFGNRLQSAKDSSVINLPAATCTDLSGCGGITHIKGGYNYSINVLEDCIPKGIGLQYSMSGLIATDFTGSLYELVDTVAGLAVNINTLDFANYLMVGIIGRVFTAAPNFAAYLTAANVAALLGVQESSISVKALGANIEVRNTSSVPRLIATIQRPAVSYLKDICGADVGRVASGSVTIYGFDSETCRPTLAWQQSAKLAYNQALYASDLGTVAAQAVPATGGVRTKLILESASFDGEDPCDNIGANVELEYLNIFNTTVTIGTSAE